MTYVLLGVAVFVLVTGLGVATGRIEAGMAEPARAPRRPAGRRAGRDAPGTENLR